MTNRQRLTAALQALLLALLAAIGTVGTAGTAGAAEREKQAEAARAAGSLPAALDRLVRRQLADYRIPGASVVVVEDGKQVYAKGYGLADADAGTKVDPERTGFFLASDAKVFTAVAVLQQVEKGRLDLSSDVNRYLKDFQIRDSHPGHPVTVRDLLTHTAGFDNTVVGLSTAHPETGTSLGESLAENQPRRVRPPGETASYDNYGVALAGHLVETVSGIPFADYVDRAILRPLGMDRTSFAQPHPRRIEAGLARGHRPDGDGQATARGQYGAWSPTGAGAVSTATDMGRLLNALLSDGGRVLRPGSDAALLKRQFGNDKRLPGLGYLLEERVRGGQRMLVKDGDLPGFHGNLALIPERRAGVYVVYNGDGEDGRAFHAGRQVAELFADHHGARATGGAERSASTADVNQYAGDYRASRTSSSDLSRASALTGSVRVTAGEDATLTTEGPLSSDPDVVEQHWVQVRPGLFREKGGQDRIAFRDGRLSIASDPSVAYQRLPWYESPVLHQRVLIGCLAVLVLTVLALPVAGLVRRRAQGRPAGARTASVIGWTTGALVTAAVACFVLLISDGNAMNETIMLGDSPLLTLVPALTTVALATTAAMLVCSVLAWRRRWWHLTGRLHYTCLTLAALLFLGLCASYRLLWPV
ncbi:class A beta-lactamase-related serine hydrolase [Streptomyces triticagri]|uniref:Class A beta-lactamase-related serine hydrolase n=1 Tax=Streptomyces triticagri TaxID=2293568 RepID=A0A372M5B2_9ACTN|nr:serine hydrolase domain-containing protein [Streptomyces triticagri]RFU86116.1 class A beta-lactamase-related serine hydrolase [Streptomyces triticagri]